MNSILTQSSKNDLKLIELLLKKEYYLRELSRDSKLSPAKIHSFIQKNKKRKIISTKKELNTIKIIINQDNILTKEIKKILIIEKILNSKIYSQIKKKGIIGIYGSYATGNYGINSDLDLLIYSSQNNLLIRDIINKLQDEINIEISLLILNDKKIKELKEKDKEFYNRLKFQSIILNEDNKIWI